MGKNDTFDSGEYGHLRYDFRKWGGKTGPIDDPSDEMIETYFDAMRLTAKKYSEEDENVDIDKMSTEQLGEYLDRKDRPLMMDAQREIAEAVAALCGNSPTIDELMALTFRVRQGFMRWVQRKVTDPEF